MREMKDSNYGYLGIVPQSWKVDKIKYHLKALGMRNHGNAQVLSVYREYGVIPKDSRDDNHNVTSEDTSNYRYVRKGDFVINKMKAWQGSMAVSRYIGIVSPAYYVYQFTDDALNRGYFHYLLRSKLYAAEFARISGGIRVGQWDLSAYNFENTMLLIPPLEEQGKIATFLDSQCSEIDAISADIQKEIETLEQYKRSVITEAVTKGLNPDAEMKDSGVAWCPQIPSHWQYSNPKGLFGLRTDRAFRDDRQLTASQEYGIVYQDEYMEKTGNKVVTVTKDFSILKHVEPDDFVISMRSFQGGLEYSDKRGCISSAYVMLIPNKEFVYAPFYRWFFKSSKYINALQSTSNLVRDGQAMRYANFVKVPLFIVPIEEQKAIASYLDEKIEKVNSILAEKKKQLEILSNYKKSLIYEYVTGKKEVLT
jgi:type I restriction enzyme, S subunit